MDALSNGMKIGGIMYKFGLIVQDGHGKEIGLAEKVFRSDVPISRVQMYPSIICAFLFARLIPYNTYASGSTQVCIIVVLWFHGRIYFLGAVALQTPTKIHAVNALGLI